MSILYALIASHLQRDSLSRPTIISLEKVEIFFALMHSSRTDSRFIEKLTQKVKIQQTVIMIKQLN